MNLCISSESTHCTVICQDTLEQKCFQMFVASMEKNILC